MMATEPQKQEGRIKVTPMITSLLEKTTDLPANAFVRSLEDGLLRPGQIEQSISTRGTLSRKHIAGTRTFGESESRFMSPLAIDEYLKRKEQLLPTFTVAHDWFKPLDNVLGAVKDDLVTLPFPECKFVLDYIEGKPHAIIRQHPDTHAIDVTSVSDEAIISSEDFKRHVVCTCVAMEMKLAGQASEVKADLGKASLLYHTASNIYKILPVKLVKKESKPHNINTGALAMRFHVRRSHWKTVKGERRRIKWYFAGNIELGIVIKDYIID